MNIRPLQDRVVVRRLDEAEMSEGGIVLPDSAKEKPMRGEIIAVGLGKVLDNGEHRAPEVKKGDQILFGKYAGTEVTLNGEELVVLREDDLMGVIE